MSKSLPSTVFAGGITPLAPPDADAPRFGPPLDADELGTLGTYRVLKRLGKGGMGAVYLALDNELERQVALKVMLPRYAADPEAAGRFRREARAAAAVRHDNVVTVYQVGEHAGTPFLAMELLTGYPLDAYLKRKGRLTIAQAMRVGVETALGLAAAHAHGLVHRDIKPANLWLEAPQGRIKILDFGLAKPLTETRGGTELTGSGSVMGTPAYMSPEQARGQPMDARSDLFSLGIVLYELCGGVRPFDGANPTAVGIAIATEEPVPLRDRNPDAPAALADVIHALLAKSAGDRPQTAAEVARRLRDLERGVVPAADLSQPPSKPTIPRVVYVPIQVTGYEPGASEFENLDDSSDLTAPLARAQTVVRRPAVPRRGRRQKFINAAMVLAAALAAGGVYFVNRPPNAREQVEPPPSVVSGGVPAVPTTPDREFARWAFKRNGRVTTNITTTEIASENDLPRVAFRVVGVRLPPEYLLTDDDVEQFKLARDLIDIRCGKTALTAAGFDKIGDLPQAAKLKWLELPHATGSAAGLAKCRNLEHLTLSQMPLAGRLGFLAGLTELQALTVIGCELTDPDLAALAGMRKLSQLVMSENRRLTAAALDHLSGPANALRYLYVESVGMDGSAARRIARFQNLVVLFIGHRAWTDADVRELAALTKLQTLSITSTKPPLTDAALLPVVAANRGLTGLSVNESHVTDALLDALHGHEKLTSVQVKGTKVTTAGVKRLIRARRLCQVEYDYDPKADADRKLAAAMFAKGAGVRLRDNTAAQTADQLPAGVIEVVAVGGRSAKAVATDADIDLLADAPALTTFDWGTTAFTDAGLERWSRAPNAKRMIELHLNSPGVTDAGTAHLVKFEALTLLNLCARDVTGVGLRRLAALPHLTHLNLNGCESLRDDHLKELAAFPKLVRVDLGCPEVTDAGLLHLAACKHLKVVLLNGRHRVTEAGLADLRKALPGCNVVWPGK